MTSSIVLLTAVLSMLALVTLALTVALVLARRAMAALAPAYVQSTESRDERITASLRSARRVAADVHAGTERALWAVQVFDGRADRLHAAMGAHRTALDESRTLLAGMRGRIEKLRTLISFLAGGR